MADSETLNSKRRKTKKYTPEELNHIRLLIKHYFDIYDSKTTLNKSEGNFLKLTEGINSKFGPDMITNRFICDIYNENGNSESKNIIRINAIINYITPLLSRETKVEINKQGLEDDLELLKNNVIDLKLPLKNEIKNIEGIWKAKYIELDFDEKLQKFVEQHVEELIKFEQSGNSNTVIGGGKTLNDKYNRTFYHHGEVYQNLYFGIFFRPDKKSGHIGGRGNCLLVISDDCDFLNGHCCWYDADLKTTHSSTYILERILD